MATKTKAKVLRSPQEETPVVASSQDPTDQDQGVERIREILFGRQMQAYEKRFSELEEKLRADAGALRDEIQKRFDELEKRLQDEVRSLNAALEAQEQRQAAELSGWAEKVRASIQTLQDKTHEDNRRLSSMLDKRLAEMKADKTDRSALADLFREAAARIGETGKSS